MNKLFLICGLVLSFFAKSNEISFKSVDDLKGGSIEINFILEKVSFIKSYSLENPSRIVMDVYDSDLSSVIDEPYNYPIKKIRATSKDNITRIVVDLYEYVNWIKPKQIKNDKGVLLSLQISKNKKLKSSIRDIVVAIDAGHGGKYPGAVGTNNILEKDVTLLIAKELQRTLRDTEGYSPVMIREGDETVALNDRYQRARQYAADILISIHADGFRLESVKGASVFIWSEEASSSVARNLSEKQRKRIQADIKNIMEDDFNEDAARKAYPEIYKQKIKDSEILGEKILNELKKDPYTKIHKKNVEYADF
jgi:N-acetylmuramoyl-L-alanine amidase